MAACSWTGDRWQTAPDHLLGHDPQTWFPLTFLDNGDIAPFNWTDEFEVDIDAQRAAPAVKDGMCILYANDATRSFYFSGVTAAGALNPQLLTFSNWDALLLGLAAGEDENTLYVVPQGVGTENNMTIATVKTSPGGTANVSCVCCCASTPST